jgi:hypothetical protein
MTPARRQKLIAATDLIRAANARTALAEGEG